MFVGNYPNSIDAKGRCIVPAKFRHELGEQCMLVIGYDSCLYLYTKEAFHEYVEKNILNLPDDDETARALKTSYFYNARECDIDKQGRINIPREFLKHAHVVKEMINVGTIDRIEIWGREFLEARMQEREMAPGNLVGSVKNRAQSGQ